MSRHSCQSCSWIVSRVAPRSRRKSDKSDKSDRSDKCDPAAKAAAALAPAKRKMSFKEKHALETLPARMEALGRDIEKLRALLADPALFSTERARFDKAMQALQHAEAELISSEEQWLALEMLREELEG